MGMTVKTVEKFNKTSKVVMETGETCVFWNDAAFAGALTVGATLEVETETKPNRQNPAYNDVWITSVNGQKAKAAGGFGGGGGGFKAPPRDESIIVAQVCLKGAIDVAIHNASTDTKARQIDPNEVKALFEEYCDLFPQGYKKLKAAIGV